MNLSRIMIILAGLLIPLLLPAQSVVNTVHNLSVSGPGTLKAAGESEICIFCHTPHRSHPQSPLWNRNDPGLNYTLYNSSTTQAAPGQPDGAAMLCLSCHDGTIALGEVLSRPSPIPFVNGVTVMPPGNANLSTDLSDDHPVSFHYSATLAAEDGELADPATLTGPVRLENEQLQCTACHDPHRNPFSDFLTVSTLQSELCAYCHQKDYWDNTSHKLSPATWNGAGNDPWFHTPYSTVSDNACENCHRPHSAGGHLRLMNHFPEEDNCLDCHNGNVAAEDIQMQLGKQYTHDVYSRSGVHDPEEPGVVEVRHAECEDCHNPHASRELPAPAPNANGFIEGVRGVNSAGVAVDPIQYQYELCYRCHADSPDKPASPTSRQIEQNNVRLEFDIGNPSYHPIEAAGQNNNVPSLLPPYTEASIIFCSDCHASDGTAAPTGPHGSIYPQILKFQYETADFTVESYQAYRLCYECHDRQTIIFSAGSFGQRVHRQHIVNEDTPCNACHDPHGISSLQGNATNNTHLINFAIAIVSPDPASGRLEFEDLGNVRGRCYLTCHGVQHSPEFY